MSTEATAYDIAGGGGGGDHVLIRSPYLQTAKTEETISHRPNNNVKVVGTSPV